MKRWYYILVLACVLAGCTGEKEGESGVLEQLVESGDVVAMRAAMAAGEVTAREITAAYLARIERYDGELGAVIAVNPGALEEAGRLDAMPAPSGRLHGIPVLVKDNIETLELPTTAGSVALHNNLAQRDAPLIENLRREGAIILGKANLSEWANFRSRRSSSGWSAVGGQARNPHDLSRSPCGSSSGSGVAVAARLAPLAIGTETNGSIVCPASMNGVVGFKPTVGLVSQAGIVPISASQDTAGPMALDVASAALLHEAMSAADPIELVGDLQGRRLGIVPSSTEHELVLSLFAETQALLADAGAALVPDLALEAGYPGFRRDTFMILTVEFKDGLNRYLAGSAGDGPQTLAELIAFNKANADVEMRWFPQDIFERSEASPGLDDPGYREALARAQAATGANGIDRLLREHELDAIISVTAGPAWAIDHVNGDHFTGSFSTFAAVSGYPHATVPMGTVHGLPIGISIVTGKGEDALALSIAAAVERALPPAPRADLSAL